MLDSNVIVIKYGGSLLEDPSHRKVFLGDVAALSKLGKKVVLVHGGGKEITQALKKQGIQARFVNGLRFTDDPTMQVVENVLGAINMRIVDELNSLKVRAVGLSGKLNKFVKTTQISELGRVGKPERVDISTFGQVLAGRSIPVFYSVADDGAGGSLNVNADDFALALAIACRAYRLVFLTDTGALLDESGKPVMQLNPLGVERLIKNGAITGGMLVKAKACVDALKNGVKKVYIAKNIHGLTDSQGEKVDGTAFVGDDQPTVI